MVLSQPSKLEQYIRENGYSSSPTEKLPLLPTPKASDGKGCGIRKCKPGQTQHLSCKVIPPDAPPKSLLNPDAINYMMGFPDDWLNLDKDTDYIPKLLTHTGLEEWLPQAFDSQDKPDRREQIKALGNAVCSFVGAIAWKRIADLLHITD